MKITNHLNLGKFLITGWNSHVPRSKNYFL